MALPTRTELTVLMILAVPTFVGIAILVLGS